MKLTIEKSENSKSLELELIQKITNAIFVWGAKTKESIFKMLEHSKYYGVLMDREGIDYGLTEDKFFLSINGFEFLTITENEKDSWENLGVMEVGNSLGMVYFNRIVMMYRVTRENETEEYFKLSVTVDEANETDEIREKILGYCLSSFTKDDKVTYRDIFLQGGYFIPLN